MHLKLENESLDIATVMHDFATLTIGYYSLYLHGQEDSCWGQLP